MPAHPQFCKTGFGIHNSDAETLQDPKMSQNHQRLNFIQEDII